MIQQKSLINDGLNKMRKNKKLKTNIPLWFSIPYHDFKNR